MKDYYIPNTKDGLLKALERTTGNKKKYYRNLSKNQLFSIYFNIMDRKLDHVKEFYRKNSMVTYV